MGLRQKDLLGLRVGAVGVPRRDGEARQDGLAPVARVVHVEAPGRLVVGGEGEAEQAPLAARAELAGEVEERFAEQLATADDADGAALLRHEQALVARVRDDDGLPEPVRHGHEPLRDDVLSAGGQCQREGEGGQRADVTAEAAPALRGSGLLGHA